MLGLLVAMLVGALVGLARGGSFKRLESARLRSLPFLFGAVAVQVAASFLDHAADGWVAFGLVVTSFALVFAFAVANARAIGMPLIAIGSFSNFLVITANRGMPVSLDAALRAGLGNPFAAGNDALTKGAHRLLTDETRLRLLADIIPLRIGATVVSIGDLLIWAGMILLLQHLMVGPRGRHHAAA